MNRLVLKRDAPILFAIAACIGAASCSSPNAGFASPCSGDEDCLPGQWCDVDELVCVGEPTPDVTGDGAGQQQQCASNEDCWSLEDGNFCNGRLTCREGRCAVDADTVVVCPPAPPCEPNVCNPRTGYCESQVIEDCDLDACQSDADCPSDDVCLTPSCIDGLCAATPLDCDDGDPCTDDLCDERGCQNVFMSQWPGCDTVPDPLACEFAWQCPALDDPDSDSICLVVDCIDGRCESVSAGGTEICNDGQDNDCDGLVDCADEACAVAAACGACGTNPIELKCNKWTSVQGLWGGAGIDKYACLDAPTLGGEIAFKVQLPYQTTVSLRGISEPVENARLMTLVGNCTGDACVNAIPMAEIAGDGSLTVPVEANTPYFFAIDQTDGQPTYFAEMFLECPEQELCQDFYDNDKDGLVDCNDPDCATTVPCEPSETKCQDGIDNDGDGLFDCDDPSCVDSPQCEGPQKCAEVTSQLSCGQVLEFVPTSEASDAMQVYPCVEGEFTGPEWVFSFTPATSTPLRVTTKSLSGEGVTTMALVAECQSAACATAASGSEPLDIFAYGGNTLYLVVESTNGLVEPFWLSVECGNGVGTGEICGDGKDNDGDGAVDCADSECEDVDPCQSFETNCFDGVDNDGDGKTDCEELWCQQNSDACAGEPGPACEPVATISCNESLGTSLAANTEGDLSSYSCLPGDFPGGEVVLSYTATTDGPVSFFALAEPFDQVSVVVFKDGCGQDTPCITAAQSALEPVTFDAEKGGTYLFILDSTSSQPVSVVDVFVDCVAVEICGDGIDNDGNGLADCADPTCASGSECGPQVCGQEVVALGCGDIIDYTFGGGDSFMSVYNCSDEAMPGPDVIFNLGSGLSGYVFWQAIVGDSKSSRAFLLAGQCDTSSCVEVVYPNAQGELQLKFEADPELNYWVVVDGDQISLPLVYGASMECF